MVQLLHYKSEPRETIDNSDVLEGDSEPGQEYDLVQDPADLCARSGGDHLAGKWGDKVLDLGAEHHAAADPELDSSTHGRQSLGFMSMRQQGQAAQRLSRGGWVAGSFKNL